MELKQLPQNVLLLLGYYLSTSDLLSYRLVDTELLSLVNHRHLWLRHLKRSGIYRPEFEHFESEELRYQLVEHMKVVYSQVSLICSEKYAHVLSCIVINDDAEELEASVLKTAKQSATALLPIAIQFGRVRIIHSLFRHFNVSVSLNWLLMAIHFESYPAVKYFIEVLHFPLFTNQRFQLFPSMNKVWDPHYVLQDKSGRHQCGTFLHYNELVLRQIIRCRHPKIVRYLKAKLDEQHEYSEDHPDRYLYLKLKRHSMNDVDVIDRCDSPDFENFANISGITL